jgi:hypothetical protein
MVRCWTITSKGGREPSHDRYGGVTPKSSNFDVCMMYSPSSAGEGLRIFAAICWPLHAGKGDQTYASNRSLLGPLTW